MTFAYGAGDGEEDDFLVGPFFGGVVFLGAAADGGVRVGYGRPSVCGLLEAVPGTFADLRELGMSGNKSVLELDAVGELVAGLERCHFDRMTCVCVGIEAFRV